MFFLETIGETCKEARQQRRTKTLITQADKWGDMQRDKWGRQGSSDAAAGNQTAITVSQAHKREDMLGDKAAAPTAYRHQAVIESHWGGA